jgi:hypothetical protein
MTAPKRAIPYTITRRYAPDPARQVLALLQLLAAGDRNAHSHMDATQAEQLAKVSRLDPEESLDDGEVKRHHAGTLASRDIPKYQEVPQ